MQTAVAHNLTLSKAGSAAVRKAGGRRLSALRSGSAVRCQALVRQCMAVAMRSSRCLAL